MSLDLGAWLDPRGENPKEAHARSLHEQLQEGLRVAVGGSQVAGSATAVDGVRKASDHVLHSFVQVLNASSADVLKRAGAAISEAESCEVSYRLRVDLDDERPDIFDFRFQDLPFVGLPVDAVRNQLAMRDVVPVVQMKALRLLNAIELDVHLGYGIGIAESEEAAPHKKREYEASLKKLKDDRERHCRKVTALTNGLPEPARSLALDYRACLQFASNGSIPLAVAVPDSPSGGDIGLAASAYDNLATEFRRPLAWTVMGSAADRRRATKAWGTYEACGVACKVIAAWLRAIGELSEPVKCEFCYRHRQTRWRCAEHASRKNESRDARLGRAIRPKFVNEAVLLSKDARIRAAMGSSLFIQEAEWQSIDWHDQAALLPDSVTRSAKILAAQLRRLRIVWGRRFEGEVADLFKRILTSASDAYRDQDHRTLGSRDLQRKRRDEAPYLLTLRQFMKLWWGDGAPVASVFTELTGFGYDLGHPLLRTGWLSEGALAPEVIHQRAWFDACDKFTSETTVSVATVVARKEKGLSLRQIRNELGCSHEKVRLVRIRAPLTELPRRTRLKPYVRSP